MTAPAVTPDSDNADLYILTEGADYLAPTEEAKNAIARSIPLRRIGEVEDISDVVEAIALKHA